LIQLLLLAYAYNDKINDPKERKEENKDSMINGIGGSMMSGAWKESNPSRACVMLHIRKAGLGGVECRAPIHRVIVRIVISVEIGFIRRLDVSFHGSARGSQMTGGWWSPGSRGNHHWSRSTFLLVHNLVEMGIMGLLIGRGEDRLGFVSG
jgi:hypothetical protein